MFIPTFSSDLVLYNTVKLKRQWNTMQTFYNRQDVNADTLVKIDIYLCDPLKKTHIKGGHQLRDQEMVYSQIAEVRERQLAVNRYMQSK